MARNTHLFVFCVFTLAMGCFGQNRSRLRAMDRRLERLENKVTEESTVIWKQLYLISSRLDELITISNSSFEKKGLQHASSVETLDKAEEEKVEGHFAEILVEGFQDEKEHVRKFMNEVEQQHKSHQTDLYEQIEDMETRISEQIADDHSYVLGEIGDNKNQTLHVKEIVDKLEAKAILLRAEVSGIKQDLVKFRINCGSWKTFKGSCYFISNTLTTWKDARDRCYVFGAHLAEVDSDEEVYFLINMAKTVSGGYGPWLGASDTETEGDWVWEYSGRKLSEGFVDWLSYEPNGGSYENCLHMYNSQHHQYRWNDCSCTFENNFICEK